MLAYCVRGLSISRDGEVSGKGTAKASWIADTLGHLAAGRSPRKSGVDRLGFISRDEGSKQWKLNRDGAYFVAEHGVLSRTSRGREVTLGPRRPNSSVCTAYARKLPAVCTPI